MSVCLFSVAPIESVSAAAQPATLIVFSKGETRRVAVRLESLLLARTGLSAKSGFGRKAENMCS